MKIKKEKLIIKPDTKFYKRQAMGMVRFPPPIVVHQNKKKYNRKREKQIWRKELESVNQQIKTTRLSFYQK